MAEDLNTTEHTQKKKEITEVTHKYYRDVFDNMLVDLMTQPLHIIGIAAQAYGISCSDICLEEAEKCLTKWKNATTKGGK